MPARAAQRASTLAIDSRPIAACRNARTCAAPTMTAAIATDQITITITEPRRCWMRRSTLIQRPLELVENPPRMPPTLPPTLA